jgi:hypothetical protein
MESSNTDGIRYFGSNTNEWVGVVLDPEAQTSDTGIKFKVAIMGCHPTDTSIVRDEDIAYALVQLPVTAGNGGGNINQTVSMPKGTVVRGRFLDGSAKQVPEITGLYPLTAKTRYGKGRFEAKDGFGGNLKPGNLLGRQTSVDLGKPPCPAQPKPGDDKTKKRETPTAALEAAGVNPDGEAKVAESPAPKNNDLDAEAQAEILKEQQTGTVKDDPGPASNAVPTEEIETREQAQAREDREAAQELLNSGEFLF